MKIGAPTSRTKMKGRRLGLSTCPEAKQPAKILVLRWSENLPRGRIDATESGIAGSESGNASRLRINTRSDPHCGCASCVDCGPDACTDGGKKGCAVSGAFLSFDNFERVAVNICLNLSP